MATGAGHFDIAGRPDKLTFRKGVCMEKGEPTARRLFRWPAMILGVAALIGVGVIAADRIRVAGLARQVASGDRAAQLKALSAIAAEREARAADEVLGCLESAQDRSVVETAGYAAMRIRDPRGIEILRCRADQGPDDLTRAQLYLFAARLSNRDQRLVAWLKEGASAAEPWRALGCSLGLMYLGRPEGGLQAIGQASTGDDQLRSFALRELRRLGRPMAEAIGRPSAWPVGEPPAGDAAWEGLARFWECYATPRLLDDLIRRVELYDPEWTEMGRLIQARNRVAKLLN